MTSDGCKGQLLRLGGVGRRKKSHRKVGLVQVLWVADASKRTDVWAEFGGHCCQQCWKLRLLLRRKKFKKLHLFHGKVQGAAS